MTKTQTVKELLSRFNLELDLSSQCLSLEIEGDFDSYEIIQRTLSFINSEGQVDYGNFDCYHFEIDNAYCEVVPDCNLQTILSYSRLKGSGRWSGCSFDCFGELSVRS